MPDEKSIFESFVTNFHIRFDKLEHSQKTYESYHKEIHKELKEELEKMRADIKANRAITEKITDELKTSILCQPEECAKKFLPRWLLNLTIGALIFIGGVTSANRWWIVEHETLYKSVIKEHIQKEKANVTNNTNNRHHP